MKRLAAREGVSLITSKHNVFTDLTQQHDQGLVGPACACWQPLPVIARSGLREGRACPPRKNLKMIDTSPKTGAFLAPHRKHCTTFSIYCDQSFIKIWVVATTPLYVFSFPSTECTVLHVSQLPCFPKHHQTPDCM